MKVHVATITDARRRTNKAFDTAVIFFTVKNSDASEEAPTKTYKFEMVNDHFLLSKLFSYTDTTSGNISDLIGKSIRVYMGVRSAIGHPTEDLFIILNMNKEVTLEELKKYF